LLRNVIWKRLWLVPLYHSDKAKDRFRMERMAARQHLVKNYARRPDIGLDRLNAVERFRRHVGRAADYLSQQRICRNDPRNAKIGYPWKIALKQDIIRL